MNYLWKERRRSWKTILLIAYLSLLLAVEFVFCIVQARTVQVIYVENRNYPGGPWQYFLDTQYLAINVIFYATLFVGTFLCDLLVVCLLSNSIQTAVLIRTYHTSSFGVVTSSGGPLVAGWRTPSSLSPLSCSSRRSVCQYYIQYSHPLTNATVMGTIWTLQSSFPGLSLYSKQPLAFGTSYYAISLGLNIVLTVLILVRLLMYRRTHLAHLPSGHAQQYLSLATLIIESAALYSIFAIMFLVSYAMNKPINQVWLGFAQAAQVPRLPHLLQSTSLTDLLRSKSRRTSLYTAWRTGPPGPRRRWSRARSRRTRFHSAGRVPRIPARDSRLMSSLRPSSRSRGTPTSPRTGDTSRCWIGHGFGHDHM